MKLLLFSDLHCDTRAAHAILKKIEEHSPDIAIGAGDFGNARKGVQLCIKILKRMACPAILVPGNNENTKELREACSDWSQAHVLHGSAAKVGEVSFFGLGGGVPVTPFGDWSYDFSEAEARRLLAGCPEQSILVSHSPPRGTVDVSSSGKSLGSVAVRETILSKRPRLVVCGHIHASAGKVEEIDGIPVINAGPSGMLWTL